MAHIAASIMDLIGNTPLLETKNFNKLYAGGARILTKLEYFNPAGSAKDRIAKAMVKDALDAGIIKPGATLIEPTSGNTGIGLAAVAAAWGFKLILTMPETMSLERRNLARAYGAELVLTPGSLGMKGALDKAAELQKSIPGSWIPSQFDNPSNPNVHEATTGPEIWRDTDGKVDIFVAGVGSGGTVSGVGAYLKKQNPAVQIVAVEPFDSPMLSQGHAGPHKIQGIGANFVPGNFHREVVDEIVAVGPGQMRRPAHGHLLRRGPPCRRRTVQTQRERRQGHCGTSPRYGGTLPVHAGFRKIKKTAYRRTPYREAGITP